MNIFPALIQLLVPRLG